MGKDKYIIYLQIDEATGDIYDVAWRLCQLNSHYLRKQKVESRIISIAAYKKAIKSKLDLLDILILNENREQKARPNFDGEVILFSLVNKETKEVEKVSFDEFNDNFDYDKKKYVVKMEIVNYKERKKTAESRLDPIENLVKISFPE